MDTTQNPNLETTPSPSHSPQTFKRTHQELIICVKQKQQQEQQEEDQKACDDEYLVEQQEEAEAATKVESGREKLKRHRVEMSGRVWIPDIWGQEDLLKKWIDSTVFDSSVEKSSIMSARDALIQEGRSTLSIENSC